MSEKELLQSQIQLTRMVVDGTLGDVSPEEVAHVPEGIAHPIGALYAHQVMSEDYVINGLIRKQQPLMETEFKGKTGVEKPMPAFGEPGMNEWARTVKIDMARLRTYAQAAGVGDSRSRLSRQIAALR
jgi:hypothetical protein